MELAAITALARVICGPGSSLQTVGMTFTRRFAGHGAFATGRARITVVKLVLE